MKPKPPVAGSHETIIIGGGIAGLACARQLCDGRRRFLLVTEGIGGRIRTSTTGVNLGAYYVRSDYRHVNRFVELRRPIIRPAVVRPGHGGLYTNRRLVLHLPQALRFLGLLREFRRRYEAFKRNSVTMSQAEALRADPLLWDLYHEPAARFIRRNDIGLIGADYLAPVVHGTAFTSPNRLSAFSLLLLALPAILPIYEFRFRFDLLLAGIERSVLFDTVTGIDGAGRRYSVHTRRSGTLTADQVVVATPIDVAARLLDLGNIKEPVNAHTFLVRGQLRQPWARATINLFPDGDPNLAIAQQNDKSTLLCSASEHPDFARFFTRWEIVEHQRWAPAFHLEGSALLECEQAPGLFLIGDHNVCGLEDAYLTGVYAANRILAGRRTAKAASRATVAS